MFVIEVIQKCVTLFPIRVILFHFANILDRFEEQQGESLRNESGISVQA